MRTSNEIKARISQIDTLVDAKERELQGLKSQFSSQTDELRKKYNEERNKKLELKAEKPSPIYTIGIIAAAVLTALLEFNILPLGFAVEAIAIIALIAIIVARSVVNNRYKKEYKAQSDAYTAEMDKYKSKIDDIESANPRIAQLDREIDNLLEEQTALSQELKAVLVREAIGANVAVVYVTRNIRSYLVGYTQSGAWSDAHVIIDGMDRGVAQEPFSIIQVTPGFHSICIRYINGTVVQDYGNIQFSLKDDVSFITFTGTKEITTTNFHDNIDGFLKESKISRDKFDSYISRF